MKNSLRFLLIAFFPLFFTLLGSYLLGSIPVGVLLGKVLGHGDIRTQGSGNTGATNAWRVGGKVLGICTFLGDALKGVLVVLLVPTPPCLSTLALLAAIIGHMFPIWLKFRGGKGIATFLGGITFISPLLGLTFITTWGTAFWFMRISSLAGLSALGMTLLVGWFLPHLCWPVLFLTSLLILWAHRDNVKRLLSGEETSFRSKVS